MDLQFYDESTAREYVRSQVKEGDDFEQIYSTLEYYGYIEYSNSTSVPKHIYSALREIRIKFPFNIDIDY